MPLTRGVWVLLTGKSAHLLWQIQLLFPWLFWEVSTWNSQPKPVAVLRPQTGSAEQGGLPTGECDVPAATPRPGSPAPSCLALLCGCLSPASRGHCAGRWSWRPLGEKASSSLSPQRSETTAVSSVCRPACATRSCLNRTPQPPAAPGSPGEGGAGPWGTPPAAAVPRGVRPDTGRPCVPPPTRC